MKSNEKGIVLEERKGGCHSDYQGMSVLALNWDFGWDTPEPPKKEGQCSCQKFELYQGPRMQNKDVD